MKEEYDCIYFKNIKEKIIGCSKFNMIFSRAFDCDKCENILKNIKKKNTFNIFRYDIDFCGNIECKIRENCQRYIRKFEENCPEIISQSFYIPSSDSECDSFF